MSLVTDEVTCVHGSAAEVKRTRGFLEIFVRRTVRFSDGLACNVHTYKSRYLRINVGWTILMFQLGYSSSLGKLKGYFRHTAFVNLT